MNIVEIITEEAWRAFEAWTREYDPDGEMTVLEQATAYGRWLDYQACISPPTEEAGGRT